MNNSCAIMSAPIIFSIAETESRFAVTGRDFVLCTI